MSYSDAPIPTTPEAQFAVWRKYVDEQIARLVRPKTSKYVLLITGTTDASGFVTFTHDAQVIPKGIFIQITSPTPTDVWAPYVDQITETTARARLLETSAGSVISYNSLSATFYAYVIV
jgi:hypothetical protein